jgi:hypothetical protein
VRALIRDQFNFKGFGWTFYKSVLSVKSFGVAFRVPLTYNFNAWDQRRALPSITASAGVYYPFSAAVFLNASVRMEWIQWFLTTATSTVIYAVLWVLWTLFVRGWIVALSALLFPLTRKLYHEHHSTAVPFMAPPNWKAPIPYSPTVEERLGWSYSWKWSRERGLERRTCVWHYYAPTVASLLQPSWRSQRPWSGGSAHPKPLHLPLWSWSCPEWIIRRVAAVGLSTSCPIPDEPYFSCSALLSLSGYYFSALRSSSAFAAAALASGSNDTNATDAATPADVLSSRKASSEQAELQSPANRRSKSTEEKLDEIVIV